MRTLGHCQDHHLDLYVGCPDCGVGRSYLALDEGLAMRDRTIEELQRQGRFACQACGSPRASVAIYDNGLGYSRQLENWRVDGATHPTPVGPRG